MSGNFDDLLNDLPKLRGSILREVTTRDYSEGLEGYTELKLDEEGLQFEDAVEDAVIINYRPSETGNVTKTNIEVSNEP